MQSLLEVWLDSAETVLYNGGKNIFLCITLTELPVKSEALNN